MYHNSTPISANDIEWNNLFLTACVESRNQVIAELNTTPLPRRIYDKIAKAIENSSLSISPATLLASAMTDEVYQTQLWRSPSRQGFHENTQISSIDAVSGLSCAKATGTDQKIIIPSNSSNKNWVDCVVTFNDSTGRSRTAYGSMKFARVQGSHQSRQIKDQKAFIERCEEYISLGLANPDDIFFGAGDGDYFHPNGDNKNSDVQSVLAPIYRSQIFIGTSGQVIDWLNSI